MDEEGAPHQGEGVTRDISIKGMFIYSHSRPPPKADLRVEVFLSSSGLESGKNLTLRVQASALVVRVEPPMKPGVQGGFATVSKIYRLLGGERLLEDR